MATLSWDNAVVRRLPAASAALTAVVVVAGLLATAGDHGPVAFLCCRIGRWLSSLKEPARLKAIEAASNKYPKPDGVVFSYGTAGFRTSGSLLSSTVFRSGVLAALRALDAGGATGLVVTASHNPAADNGVKIVDADGGMLPQSWEPLAESFANAPTAAALAALAGAAARAFHHAPSRHRSAPLVILGRDTRATGPALVDAAAAGCAAMGVPVLDLGIRTTPQVHFAVRATNRGEPAGMADYNALLSAGFLALAGGAHPLPGPITVDCANGVGAPALQSLLASMGDAAPRVVLRNVGETGPAGLNACCGADHVQKAQEMPAGFAPGDGRCASLDGDADRLVYFWPKESKESKESRGESKGQKLKAGAPGMTLCDGDKIAALVARTVVSLLAEASPHLAPLVPRVGVVQTAYANGASGEYLRRALGLTVVLAPTGVKHLHHEAASFDFGVYFEANGHGTALFSARLATRLESLVRRGGPAAVSARVLLAVRDVLNQAVGDGLSSLLFVEAALRRLGWGMDEWAGLYTDLPSRQLKVSVGDRAVVATSHAETICTAPAGLQAAVDALVATTPRGRAFVRPSGTEDCVRVYAEAESQVAADALASGVARAVHRLAGGVGAAPK